MKKTISGSFLLAALWVVLLSGCSQAMAQPDEASADDLPVTSEESETEQEQVQSAAEQEKPIV